MKPIRCFFLAIAFLLISSPVFAAIFSVTPRLTVGEQFTDNVFLSASDEEYDFITTVSPGVTTGIEGRSAGATLSYDPEKSFYARLSEMDTFRHRASFAGWKELSRRTRIDVSDAFLYTEDPLDLEEFVVRRDRQPYHTNSASVNLTHQFGEEDSFEIGYTYRMLRNDDPEVENNHGHNPAASITYWLVPNKWGLQAEASYTRGEYEDMEDDFDRLFGSVRLVRRFTRQIEGHLQYAHTDFHYDGDTEGYKLYNPSVGITYQYDPDTTITGSVGYLMRDYDESDNREGFTPTGEIGITKQYRRFSFHVAFLGGYRESYLDAENLGLSVYYGGEADAAYQFMENLRGTVFASYRDEKYDSRIPGTDDRLDQTVRSGCGLAFQALPWMSLNLDYLFSNRDSNIDEEENEFTENRATFRITVSPERPYRWEI